MAQRTLPALAAALFWAAAAHALDDGHLARLEALHGKADGLIAVNDFTGALAIYEEILLLEPDDAAAYVNAGTCHLILGRFDAAEEAYRNALHIDPENEAALTGLRRIRDPDSALWEAPGTDAPDPPAEPPPAWLARPSAPDSIAPERAVAFSPDTTLQRALKNAGYYEGPIDGIFGKRSRKALRTFQAEHGLTPDGKAGVKTWEALRRYLDDQRG